MKTYQNASFEDGRMLKIHVLLMKKEHKAGKPRFSLVKPWFSDGFFLIYIRTFGYSKSCYRPRLKASVTHDLLEAERGEQAILFVCFSNLDCDFWNIFCRILMNIEKKTNIASKTRKSQDMSFQILSRWRSPMLVSGRKSWTLWRRPWGRRLWKWRIKEGSGSTYRGCNPWFSSLFLWFKMV